MGFRILVVEDENEIADFVVRGLREEGYAVERAARPLDLTAKGYALLVFFLRHPGEVLSRTRIYEHVWDERYDGLSNTLEVHVMELRKKLEAYGGRLIHTLRNRGYRFAGDAE